MPRVSTLILFTCLSCRCKVAVGSDHEQRITLTCMYNVYTCMYIVHVYHTYRCCNNYFETAALSCVEDGGPFDASIGNYCPASPQLSVNDALNGSVSGPLDSDNTYIAEYLLRVSDDLLPSVFFHEVQAGFVVSYQEPALSFCKQNDATDNRKIVALLEILANMSAFNFNDEECNETLLMCRDEIYAGNFSACKRALELDNCVGDVLPNITTIPGSFYNSLPYNLQQYLYGYLCPSSESVTKVYPVQDNTMTVTIWYNNQVSHTSYEILDECLALCVSGSNPGDANAAYTHLYLHHVYTNR